MKEETKERISHHKFCIQKERISHHKFCIQIAIEEYWDCLKQLYAKDEITKRRYNHLKTFPQRFIEFETEKEQER